MHRLFGTILAGCALLVLLGSSAALAYESPQKYGLEIRPGFSMYDMGDVSSSIERVGNRAGRTFTEEDSGPTAGFSFIVRPSRHTMWTIGYNALLDVDNEATSTRGDSSAQILMHANEFFLKGGVVATITDRFHLDIAAGFSYYNTEIQIQDDYSSRFNYDAVGRSWGVLGSLGLEYIVTQRLGIAVEGGARLTNSANFSYDSGTGVRSGVNVLGGTRPIEVNLSGPYAALGLRFYFDKTTRPIDFTR